MGALLFFLFGTRTHEHTHIRTHKHTHEHTVAEPFENKLYTSQPETLSLLACIS